MRHLLVFADRDDAEEVAETLEEWLGQPPRVVRETLAGEDDAEDAQWVVVIEEVDDAFLGRVDALAEQYDGWRES
ncbi:hypothetical protein SAMN05421505_15016 [Sinosporangium album]|uniref:Uncharacterized protein n=1 Tax=Sinosporangium album TaxID=504805 RepID=A0A1G8KF57_9ACTN|nr:hypothetical protein [Sinosporangium album]SDI42047.1 hypothetical protein SAMN05421505_15016 [Sinosporangium album]